jgi:DHA2 family multidrug resistance protein
VLILIPFGPMLMRRFDVRLIGFMGLALFALSCSMNVQLSADNAGDQFFLPNIVRAIAQALVITPISAITTSGVAPKDAGAASGLSNMMRNLGGAVGTAALATVITKREQYHSNIIGQSVNLGRDEVRQRIDQMASYFAAHASRIELRRPTR